MTKCGEIHVYYTVYKYLREYEICTRQVIILKCPSIWLMTPDNFFFLHTLVRQHYLKRCEQTSG